MAGDRIELLRQMAAFGGLKTESLNLILADSANRIIKEGEFFFHAGDSADSLFILESGSVVIQRDWQGAPIELGQLHAGDCFGEMSLIDFQPRSASVKAQSDCQAIEIPTRVLRALYQQDVEQYAMIMMNLGREVSRRLRAADQRLFELQQFSEHQIT